MSREQDYFYLLKPRYNIKKIARSSLGYKHTEQTMDLITNYVSTCWETRTKISKARLGKKHSEEIRGKRGAKLKGRKTLNKLYLN